MWGSRRPAPLLRFRRRQWAGMIADLGRRGAAAGGSESGAFLLADRDGDPHVVTRIVYLDDLDPNCLQGGIAFNGLAYGPLWDMCAVEQLIVIGDIHTHPHVWVGQSDTDKGSPMVALRGHLAVIVPDLATHPVKPIDAGLHEYRGSDGWISWTGKEAARRLHIKRWR
jgi:hypothetical protein